LSETQLDRFLMRLSIGYPSLEAEEEMLGQGRRADALESLQRSGLEIGVVWIRNAESALGTVLGSPATEEQPPALPEGLPIYQVASEDDLLSFAGQAL
jgi:MoxR-like ATPase